MCLRNLNDACYSTPTACQNQPLTNRTLATRIAFALVVLLAVSHVGVAQDGSKSQAEKGGLVQQLRSLSDSAIDVFKPDQTTSGKSAPRQKYNPKVSRPTGRTASQRVHNAPPPGRTQKEPLTAERPDKSVKPERQPVASQDDNVLPQVVKAMNYQSTVGASVLRTTPPKTTLAKTETQKTETQKTNVQRSQAPEGVRERTLQQDPEVHVEESLPPIVRQSIRGNNAADRSGNAASSTTESAAEKEFQIFPRGNAPANGLAQQATTAVPQVSRIPLPTPHKVTQPSGSQRATELANPNPARVAHVNEAYGNEARYAPETDESLEPSVDTLSALPALRTPKLGSSSMDGSSRMQVPTALISTPTAERFRPNATPSAPLDEPLPVQVQERDLTGTATPTDSALPIASMNALPNAPLPTATAPVSSSTNLATLPTLPTLDPPALSMSAMPQHSPTDLGGRVVGDGNSEQRIRMEAPRVQVMLNGPSDLPVGSPAQYEIVVQNSDAIELSGIILRLDIPAGVNAHSLKPTLGNMQVEKASDGATLFTWAFTGLAAGKTASAPIELIATSARNFGVAMEWTIAPVAGSSAVEVRAPMLELVLEGPAEVNFGEANTYRLHVRNPGSADATHVAVKLSAEPYGASTSNIGTIKAGAEETIDVELTFNEPGTIGIAANATANNDLSSLTKINVLVRRPNLAASIEGPELIYHGASVDYLVTVSNTGDAEAKDITASLTLPAGAKLIHLPNAATLRDGKMTWPISSINAGETLELPLQLNLTQAGENKLSIVCSTPTGLTSDYTTQTTVEAFADLHLLMEDPLAPAAVGREVVYGLTLTNRGSKVANNVRVIAQFSEGIEPLRSEGCQSRIAPGQLFFEPIKRIEAGQSITLKVIALADKAGMHRFRAEVRSDGTEQKLVQEESTQYLNRSTGRIASPPSQNVIR